MKVIGERELFPHGSIIFREGEYGHKMYIILKGFVEIIKRELKRGHTVTVLEPGDFFGEMSVIRGSKRIATARAKGDVECRSLSTADLKILLTHNLSISIKIIRGLCDRVEENLIKIESLKFFSEKQKIIIFFIKLLTENGQKLVQTLKMPYIDLVDQLHEEIKLGEEHIDGLLIELSKEGYIDVYEKDNEYYVEIGPKVFQWGKPV